ncbi:MAG: hypothetical protein Athens041674_69 [Parcubacteria group bacterium Athens0416_74]|nr:MAG: hypothetical protein Athens041674_69 [Parcubacteria group bacterium Athens0416_74]
MYTVPFGSNVVRRGLDKALRISHVPPLHRTGLDALIPWQRPIRAPHSISYHVLHALQKHGKVRFYSLYEKGCIHLADEDIFIGQPVPHGGFSLNGRPTTDEANSVTSATLRYYEGSKHSKFLILPFANDEGYISWARSISTYADGLILVGGAFWRKDMNNTPLGNLTTRRVLALNMCVDSREFPLLQFLYVGHTGWYKNVAELERVAASMPHFEGGHIGSGHIKGWKKISDFASLNRAFMAKVAEEYDIFVNTSSADPQATTILEHMCFGFPIACTPESGYTYDSITRLSVSDTEFNCRQLSTLRNVEENTLRELSSRSYQHVVQSHNWKSFTDQTLSFLDL